MALRFELMGTMAVITLDRPGLGSAQARDRAVDGHAIDLGLALALRCDLRITATDATDGVAQVRRAAMRVKA